MDFAEFSDIETMGFATYRQKLQEQFSEDIERGIIQAHAERCNSENSVKIIPIIGNAVALGDALLDRYRLNNKNYLTRLLKVSLLIQLPSLMKPLNILVVM